MKCGQEKPYCRRCTSTGRKCEYASAVSPTFAASRSTASIFDHPLSLAPSTVWRERRAFAYYSEHAARSLAGNLDLDFWGRIIPRVCRSEPAVWDAINAISALFESPDPCLDPVFLSCRGDFYQLSQNHREALSWYSRSLTSIRQQIDRGSADGQVAIITCVLFICIEIIQGRFEAGLQLYQQGVELILNLRSSNAMDKALLEGDIIPLFLRLGTVALSISGVPRCKLSTLVNGYPEAGFASVSSARAALTAVISDAMIFERTAERSKPTVSGAMPEEIITEQKAMQNRFACWHWAYTQFKKTHQAKSPPETSSVAETTLMITHATALTMVSTCLAMHETVYDEYLPTFEAIISHARVILDTSAGPGGSQPPFTFEMGVGLPLFYTAMHCRHPVLRRQALSMLREAPPVQGFYKCAPGIAIAQAMMELEEEFAAAITESSPGANTADKTQGQNSKPDCETSGNSIPEEARIRFVGIFRPSDTPWRIGEHDIGKWNRSAEQLFMTFSRPCYDLDSQTWRRTEDMVPLDF